jgi:hypothetical protein
MTRVTRASIAYVATQVRRRFVRQIGQSSLISCRSGSACRLRPYFQDLIRPPIRSGSTLVFWSCWMIPKKQMRLASCSSGGIGKHPVSRDNSSAHPWKSQIFPSYLSVPSAPTENSVLSRIRAKRAAVNAAKSSAHPADSTSVPGSGTSSELS